MEECRFLELVREDRSWKPQLASMNLERNPDIKKEQNNGYQVNNSLPGTENAIFFI